jgi:hypothetical protein
MTDRKTPDPEEGPLNPALKRRTDRVYDTDNQTPAPVDTASAKEGEGEGWPIAWAIVTVLSIILAIYFIL